MIFVALGTTKATLRVRSSLRPPAAEGGDPSSPPRSPPCDPSPGQPSLPLTTDGRTGLPLVYPLTKERLSAK